MELHPLPKAKSKLVLPCALSVLHVGFERFKMQMDGLLNNCWASPHTMRISRLLFPVGLAVAFYGCQQRSANTVPSGSFRLVVDDMLKDETFRVASLKVSSVQPGTLSVDMEGSSVASVLPVSTPDGLREGRAFFIASRATDSTTTNAFMATSLQVKVEGGTSGGCTTDHHTSKSDKLADFVSMTAKNGIYPLDTPLEIGRIDGKAVTLTVGKPTK